MPEIILGAIVLFLALWAVNAFSKIDPKQAARLVRTLGGTIALLFAGFLLLRDAFGAAVVAGLFGLGLLGFTMPWRGYFAGAAQKGPASQVRTANLEMELDHDSGTMRGRVLTGRYQGMSLDALDLPALISLLGEIDDNSRDLLAAYLDRRSPGWREHAQHDASAGGGSRPARGGKMTEEEAYQILGLQPGASADDISRAHRSLMKKLHPDQGGSTYLAARVNEAKDVLLRRHR
jgi:hypothetical protein